MLKCFEAQKSIYIKDRVPYAHTTYVSNFYVRELEVENLILLSVALGIRNMYGVCTCDKQHSCILLKDSASFQVDAADTIRLT
jgi:hypothetical protein